MKTLKLISASIALLPAFAQAQTQNEIWTNTIIQTVNILQEDGSIVTLNPTMEVDRQGTATSLEIIPVEGAQFELITRNEVTGEEFSLDTPFVSANNPTAEIIIESGDKHAGIARVRADKPFTVTTDVDKLITAGDKVDARLTKLNWFHYTLNSLAQEGVEVVAEASELNKNEASEKAYTRTNIAAVAGENADKVKGTERFIAELIDTPEDFVDPEIDTALLQVYPKPTGKFLKFGEHVPGIVTDGNKRITINTVPSTLEFALEDMYPGGSVSIVVDIQSGGALDTVDETTITPTDEDAEVGESETVNTSGKRIWSYNVPVDIDPDNVARQDELTFPEVLFNLTAANLQIQHNDKLVFKLIHEDPFGEEQLDSFEVDADLIITLRGNVSTSE